MHRLYRTAHSTLSPSRVLLPHLSSAIHLRKPLSFIGVLSQRWVSYIVNIRLFNVSLKKKKNLC